MAKKKTDNRRPSRVLMYFYLLFLCLSFVIVSKIYKIQNSWEPNPKFVKEFLPSKHLKNIQPHKGSILDHSGNVLAISIPRYNIFMDCYVLKEDFAYAGTHGEALEQEWLKKADALAACLADFINEPGKDSTHFSNLIRKSRAERKRYVPIATEIDYKAVEQLKTFPLFNESPNKGGLIVKMEEKRMYPYGGLAKKIIGDVNMNNPDNPYIGIEGAYYHKLKGVSGKSWAKYTDNFNLINDIDSTSVDAEDGLDVRTTLDINIQEIADRALRQHVDTAKHINSACVVILDVKTGGVKAMVNLKRDSKGKMTESFNSAVARASEPGSIFKTVMLTTLLEDEHVTLMDQMPIKIEKMRYPGFKDAEYDKYAFYYEARHKTGHIPVIHGFMVSSNYVFRRQVTDHYYQNPHELITRLHSYNLGSNFNFEITETGGSKPSLPDPDADDWNGSTIPSMAIGYSVKVTPLQILAFYNAIANGGKMMKPYIVESIEKNGEVVEKREPALYSVVCSKTTADSVTRAMTMVCDRVYAPATKTYTKGTAYDSTKGAKCTIAGKTGTAWIRLENEEKIGAKGAYKTKDDTYKYQASFAGFFPAEDPKYSMIVIAYTDPTPRAEGGGTKPAKVFKQIVDELWAYDEYWQREITAKKENW